MSIHRTIADDHPFFDECLQLYLLNLSTLAVGLHVEAQRDAARFAATMDELFVAFKARNEDKAMRISVEMAGEHELPDYPPVVCWQSFGCDEDCLLHVSQPLVDFARRGENKPTILSFEVVPTIQSIVDGKIEFTDAPEGYVPVDGAVPTALFETVFAYLIGGAYERFKDHFVAKFGGKKRFPPEVQFFRHLRNGCFHKNEFSIDRYDGMDQIDPSCPPKWHNYVMPSDAAMNGKKVIGNGTFFHATHMLLFLDDMRAYL